MLLVGSNQRAELKLSERLLVFLLSILLLLPVIIWTAVSLLLLVTPELVICWFLLLEQLFWVDCLAPVGDDGDDDVEDVVIVELVFCVYVEFSSLMGNWMVEFLLNLWSLFGLVMGLDFTVEFGKSEPITTSLSLDVNFNPKKSVSIRLICLNTLSNKTWPLLFLSIKNLWSVLFRKYTIHSIVGDELLQSRSFALTL